MIRLSFLIAIRFLRSVVAVSAVVALVTYLNHRGFIKDESELLVLLDGGESADEGPLARMNLAGDHQNSVAQARQGGGIGHRGHGCAIEQDPVKAFGDS